MFSSATAANRAAVAASSRFGGLVNGLARNASGGFAARALALVFLQKPLADADRLRRDLDKLVVGDELDRIFERQADRRRQQDRIVLAGRADVGQLLAFDRVDDEIVVTAVDADHHALVELLTR